MTRSLCLLAVLTCAACGGDDGPTTATLVEPVYRDPCPTFSCSGLGECIQREPNGPPSCLCTDGYAGLHCEACELGFHRDADAHCVPDKSCADSERDPCGVHGDCNDDDGVVACACANGYVGARCNRCALGYALTSEGECLQKVQANGRVMMLPPACTAGACNGHGACTELDAQIECDCYVGYDGARCELCEPNYRHPEGSDRCIPSQSCRSPECGGCIAFDSARGFPAAPDTCVSASELKLDGVSITSIGGQGKLWLCASSGNDGFSSEHVGLEADDKQAAEFHFDTAVVEVSFDYAAWQSQALDVLADGNPVEQLDGKPRGNTNVKLAFDAPVHVVGLRSRDVYRRSFAIDNLVYRNDSSACR